MGYWGRQQEKRPQTTCSRHDPTNSNSEDDVLEATCKAPPENVQQTSGHMQRPNRENAMDDTQCATDKQHAPCSGRHAACNRQHAPDFMQHAASNNDMQRNRQHAPGNVQNATETRFCVDNAEKATDSVHRATNMQQGKRQQATCGLQQTTVNVQHATDNVHQTADGMQEDASTCEMQQETHGTAAFRAREQRAADNQQYARSVLLDNQCATRHRRHTRCNTRQYDPCRSMQQTQTEPTTRSKQCNVRDETNEIRTLAHLGARCAGGGGVGWSVGLWSMDIAVLVRTTDYGTRRRWATHECGAHGRCVSSIGAGHCAPQASAARALDDRRALGAGSQPLSGRDRDSETGSVPGTKTGPRPTPAKLWRSGWSLCHLGTPGTLAHTLAGPGLAQAEQAPLVPRPLGRY
jgi:hypothetical protein